MELELARHFLQFIYMLSLLQFMGSFLRRMYITSAGDETDKDRDFNTKDGGDAGEKGSVNGQKRLNG